MLTKRIIASILSFGTLFGLASCEGANGYKGRNQSEYECASLTEYPNAFNTDGMFSGYFVVGWEAETIDNLSMTDIAVNMRDNSGECEGDDCMIRVVNGTKLDTEIDDVSAYNIITIGGPCYNSVTAEVMGKEYGVGNPDDACLEDFAGGEGRVMMLQHKETGKLAMVVAGFDGDETRLAAKVIAHRPNEIRGYEFGNCEVVVSGDNYQDATIEVVR